MTPFQKLLRDERRACKHWFGHIPKAQNRDVRDTMAYDFDGVMSPVTREVKGGTRKQPSKMPRGRLITPAGQFNGHYIKKNVRKKTN